MQTDITSYIHSNTNSALRDRVRHSCWKWLTTFRVHSKLKGQNSKTFEGLLKDLKLQFSSTKIIDKKTYHTRAVTTIT